MTPTVIALYGLLFAVATAASWIATAWARRLAIRFNYVDNPGARKLHQSAMPYGGGVAMCAVTTGGMVLGWLLLTRFEWRGVSSDLAALLEIHRPGLTDPAALKRAGAILGGSLMVFALGLVDDVAGLRPRWKLLVQALAAMLLVAGGVRITFFIESYWITAGLTILWVVGVTNAFNLLDNMDGLSAGVAAVAAGLCLVVAVQGERFFVAGFLAIFTGALVGFLRHNFAPARLFMGDAGSLWIGFVLAALTVAGTYYEGRGGVYAAAMPLLILGVPLFDTASVMLLRWRRGKPLFVGDRNHLSHRLVRLGMTTREAVLTIYLLGAILGGAATLLAHLPPAGAAVIFLLGLGVIALVVLLETAAARREADDSPV